MIQRNDKSSISKNIGKKTWHLSLIYVFISVFYSHNVFSIELKSGDIILQPLNCWTCYLIEAQENSEYSHMGLYLKIDNRDYVLEAFGKVRLVSLEKFLEKTEKNTKLLVRRFKNKNFIESELINRSLSFLEHEYDKDFIWDNFDDEGKEKLYCSELVYKVFEPFYSGLPIKRMRYNIYREHWIRYFNGLPPDGKWGNAPADFEKSDLLIDIGYL